MLSPRYLARVGGEGVKEVSKGWPNFFLEGGGMKIIEKNCLQGLERQNKLFANTICVTKISKNFEKKCLQRCIN